MPERNSRQAMVIEDAEVLPNPNGTAPGMFIDHQGTAIVLLPGPPREMRPMFENHVAERLAGRAGSLRVVRRMLRVAGMGESAVDEKIAPVYTQYDNPQTTILFNQSEIEIHLTARGRTKRKRMTTCSIVCRRRLKSDWAMRCFRLRRDDGRSRRTETVVGGYTLSVAESCTGGFDCATAHGRSGFVEVFHRRRRGVCERCEDENAWCRADVVDGARRRECAGCGSDGGRHSQTRGTDFGLSITGIAGPGGGTEEKPVGTVFIALRTT
jgi:nicotinamide-nucleotide amidase